MIKKISIHILIMNNILCHFKSFAIINRTKVKGIAIEK